MMMREKTLGSRYAPITEAQHQAALIDWWAWACKGYGQEEEDLYHPPNESPRSVGYGSRLKREGMRPGFPDLEFNVPAHDKPGLYIELKTWGGKVSAAQAAYLDRLRRRGYAACLCYGWEAARKCIEDYLAGKEIPEKM